MIIEIINGPNLNLLGKREIEMYGQTHFEDFLERLRERYPTVTINYFQSNSEGSIIDRIHEVGFLADGIIINAGAYTHTSIAIADAISSIKTPVIEVHISNIFNREEYRHHSYLTPKCEGIISGLGLDGYRLGIEYFIYS